MIRRETRWVGDRGTVQVAVCVLDDSWEPLREVTTAVGPFDDDRDVMLRTHEAVDRWVATYGIQEELWR